MNAGQADQSFNDHAEQKENNPLSIDPSKDVSLPLQDEVPQSQQPQ